jgi:hypothetical protein
LRNEPKNNSAEYSYRSPTLDDKLGNLTNKP